MRILGGVLTAGHAWGINQCRRRDQLRTGQGARRWPQTIDRHARGRKLTPRERIRLLRPLGPHVPATDRMAAYGNFQIHGAGIGAVCSVECMIVANDPTVKERHQQSVDASRKKIAGQPDLRKTASVISSAGPYEEILDSHDLAQLSAARIPMRWFRQLHRGRAVPACPIT